MFFSDFPFGLLFCMYFSVDAIFAQLFSHVFLFDGVASSRLGCFVNHSIHHDSRGYRMDKCMDDG